VLLDKKKCYKCILKFVVEVEFFNNKIILIRLIFYYVVKWIECLNQIKLRQKYILNYIEEEMFGIKMVFFNLIAI